MSKAPSWANTGHPPGLVGLPSTAVPLPDLTAAPAGDPLPGLSTGLTWATSLPLLLPRDCGYLRVWGADRSPHAQTVSCAVRGQQARERGEDWVTRLLSPDRKVTAFPTQTANISLKVMKIKTGPIVYPLFVKINS